MKLALIGGFLGSGKTTAIVKASQLLIKQNKTVAVITNDQGDQLVDSECVKGFGIPVREVANGCFCCNYDQLDSQLQSLQDKNRPEIIFAESVGSCTDMIATIAKPLHKLRPEIEIVITVFADAGFLASSIERRALFLEGSVNYIYKKQLEEADLLILNKIDQITPKQLSAVDAMIRAQYPGKTVLHQNSLTDHDVLQWLKAIDLFTAKSQRNSLQLDYDIYANGESKLAWLDKTIVIKTENNKSVSVARNIVSSIFSQIHAHELTIGHLKFILKADNWKEKISFTASSTSADIKVTDHKSHEVKMLINCRVQTDPGTLEKIVADVLTNAASTNNCTIVTEKWSVFSPGYPKPTHRMS